MYEKYAGDKDLIKFDGDHNSKRPLYFYDSAVIFFTERLQVNQLLTEDNTLTDEQKLFW